MNGPRLGKNRQKAEVIDDPKDGPLVHQWSVDIGIRLDQNFMMARLHLELSMKLRDPTNGPLMHIWSVGEGLVCEGLPSL